jgi:glycosyltransferase involved in cell wall biosynthesis
MISVVIPTSNSARLLPRCFDSLIPGVVRGVVRDVVIADGGSSDETFAIADAAGAHFVSAGKTRGAQMAAGAEAARGEWLLFLHPETALEPGWENEADSFLEQATLERPRAAVFRFAVDDFGGHARRTEAIVSVRSNVLGQPCGGQGLLIPKRFYQKLGGYRAAALEDIDLVRRIGRSRIVTMRSRAVNKVDAVPAHRLALGVLHALRVPKRLVAYIGR